MSEKTVTVFLAEDHVMVREGLAVLINRDPMFSVIGQCGNGLKVVGQVKQLKPDVVVLDITMPGLNGLDICHQITKKCKGTAVLILTMHDDEQFIATAMENGALGYLLKEAVGSRLIDALKAVVSGKIYFNTGVSKDVLQRIVRSGDSYENLTMRERQVLQMIAEGKKNRQIANDLGISVKTVETHRFHLMQKLDIHNQTDLVKYALRRGVVKLR